LQDYLNGKNPEQGMIGDESGHSINCVFWGGKSNTTTMKMSRIIPLKQH
ncbi:unnamed protein product, partial [Didymodactylos carnosus]